MIPANVRADINTVVQRGSMVVIASAVADGALDGKVANVKLVTGL